MSTHGTERIYLWLRNQRLRKHKKQLATVEKYREKREALKAVGDYEGLSKLPRNASPTRIHNRDRIDGRPHGFMRKFGVSRIRFRELAHQGKIPGVKKASF